MSSRGVRPSVCDVRVFCRNEYIYTYLQFFSPSGSHTILVFPIPNVKYYGIFRRGPRNVVPNPGMGWAKMSILDECLAIESMTAAVRSTIDGRPCSSVGLYNSYDAGLFTAQTATHQ